MTTRRLNLYSRNSNVAAGDTELIAPGGMSGDLTDAGGTLRIKAGGNAGDTAAGAGCREITIVGLDATGAEVTETLATAGALASDSTTTEFYRINEIKITGMGTALSTQLADMVIELSAGGDVATMSRGEWGGHHFTVPLGYKAIINKIKMTSDRAVIDMIVTTYKNSVAGGTAPFSSSEIARTYYSTGDTVEWIGELTLDPLELMWIKARNGNNGNAAIAIITVEITGTLYQI